MILRRLKTKERWKNGGCNRMGTWLAYFLGRYLKTCNTTLMVKGNKCKILPTPQKCALQLNVPYNYHSNLVRSSSGSQGVTSGGGTGVASSALTWSGSSPGGPAVAATASFCFSYPFAGAYFLSLYAFSPASPPRSACL